MEGRRQGGGMGCGGCEFHTTRMKADHPLGDVGKMAAVVGGEGQ